MRYCHNFDRENQLTGGETFAIEKIDGIYYVGISHCSYKDEFNRKIGKELATKRLSEMVNTHSATGTELILNVKGLIDGFIINEKLLFYVVAYKEFMDEYSDSLIGNISNHIKIGDVSFDIEHIEGRDLLRCLIRYYNFLMHQIGGKYMLF